MSNFENTNSELGVGTKRGSRSVFSIDASGEQTFIVEASSISRIKSNLGKLCEQLNLSEDEEEETKDINQEKLSVLATT